jgi:polysaccharide deacetylase family protein (PEP-CTERM system associated)
MTASPVNAMSVDVEDYFHVAALSEAISRDDWEGMNARVVQSTRRLLEVFDAADTKATFFVLGWVADRHPELVKEIHRRGHEIACHGYSHRMVYDQAPEEFRAETLRSKGLLEDLTGEPVAGYRAASYSITPKSRWALDILVEAGFLYDSSIFPVRHDLYGMPDAPRFPHVLTTDNGAKLVEFPPSTARLLGQNLPAAGGGYFRLYPYALSRWLIQRVNRDEGQPVIFYLHPWEVDPEQPRVEAGWRSKFRHYNNLEKCEGRLRQLLGDFRFGTARDVLSSHGLLATELAPAPAPVRPGVAHHGA